MVTFDIFSAANTFIERAVKRTAPKIVQSNFKDIEKEIKKIRVDYDRRGDIIFNLMQNEKNNIMNQINSNNSSFNNLHFQKVNKCLNKMTKNFLNFLNMNVKV